PWGQFDFHVLHVHPGGSAIVTLTLPAGSYPTGYDLIDPATGLPESFLFDGTTGAEFHGNVVTLHFVDGGRGDADGVANGVISDPGGAGSTRAQFHFAATSYTVAEDGWNAAVTVVRGGDLTGTVSVDYATADG